MQIAKASMIGMGVAVLLSCSATSQPVDCRKIGSASARLACYDTEATQTQVAKPHASMTDPIVRRAKLTVAKILRDPSSAKFSNLKVAKAADGSSAVCGEVNAKNSLGGMTGSKLFVYDGAYAHLLVSDAGADNPTRFDSLILGAALGETLKLMQRYCKTP